MCTGVPPAKSRPPIFAAQPLAFHVQHAIGSYTTVDHTNMKTTQGSMRPRSATAPTASATVMQANIPWYTANRRSGILGLPTLGAASTFLKPMLSRLPMKKLASCEKARLYPLLICVVSIDMETVAHSYTYQKNHWKLTTPTDMIESHISESADLRRARPE